MKIFKKTVFLWVSKDADDFTYGVLLRTYLRLKKIGVKPVMRWL